MKYSVIAGLFCLLFSLGITSAKVHGKLVLSPEELRQIVIELVKSEVQASLPTRAPQALAIESPVKQQLLRIQMSINQTIGMHDVFRSDFNEQLQQVGHECRRAAAELRPPSVSNGGALNASTLRNELQAIASDIVTIKASLERVQVNIQLRSTENITTRVSSTQTTPMSTSTLPAKSIQTAFENAVASKTARIGRSFNGSTIDEISAVVSRTGYGNNSATVEFANFLNEAVTDFQLYHKELNTPVYHYAPSEVAANTKEVFTFREPRTLTCYQDVAFSYSIPPANQRIAVRLLLRSGDGFGLSFLSDNASLENYYTTKVGLPGASEYTFVPYGTSYPTTRQLFIRHQNWLAKAAVILRDQHEVNVRIELVEGP